MERRMQTVGILADEDKDHCVNRPLLLHASVLVGL